MATPELPEPSKPKQNSIRLDRDERIRVLTLRDAVQYTCQNQQATPKKARGNPPKLSEAEVDYIIEWISSSKRTRRMPYYKVVQELNLSVGKHALARALKKRGYTRCIALRRS
ncbi:hypothetical protein TMatcc_006708 [Talaromyces marneffei ATCC 18224]